MKTFTDGVLSLDSAKVYMDPEATPYAYVSSHNDRFKEKNRELETLQKV
jgi:thioredoxin reductase (NADPH)